MEQEKPDAILLSVIDKILEFTNEGKQAKAQHILPFVYESVMQFPMILWDNPQVWKIAKVFLIMHHYDLIEDEDDEITMLQMALVYTQRAIELNEKQPDADNLFQALHTQVLLYSTCADYYETTIADLYAKTVMTDEERMISKRLASKVSPMLYYNTLVKIDDSFENFNNDSFLAEMCNAFELEHPDVTPKQLEDAVKIHRILIRTYCNLLKKDDE